MSARRISRSLSFREHVRQRPKPIAGGGQLTLTHLRRHELSKRDTQVGSRAAHLVVRAARARLGQRRGRIDEQAAMSADGHRLRHHRHDLGHARNGLPIERHTRIRPAPRRQHVRTCDVDGRPDRPHARTIRRQPREYLGLCQRQRLSTRARRQYNGRQHGAEHQCAHTDLD